MKPIKSLSASIILFFLLLGQVSGQQSQRQYISTINTGGIDSHEYQVVVSDGKYVIDILNDNILHVTFLPQNKEVKDFSYAAVMKPENNQVTFTEEINDIKISTEGISVTIDKQPFNISYSYKGNPLLKEQYGYSQADSSWMINLGITNSEVLYGGGARALGMNRRGNRLMLYNRAHYGYETHAELMNYTLPLVMSSNKYAVLFDNAGLGYLDLDSKKTNTISYETYSGIPNYYIIAGNDWFDLTSQYTLLTGRQPLPPRWALGNFSSRFGYHTQKQTERTVDKFFKDDIALDAVIIDIYWFGKEIKGSMGNLDWYTDSFPSPASMIKRFKNKGVNTILVTEPFILTTSKRWDEAVKADILSKKSNGEPYTYDFYFGNTGLIDLYKPEAREWFWNIYKGLILQGIDGCWGDLGEPEVHPADIIHAVGTGNEIHNAYGHEWAKLIYDGYKKDFPDKRPFILMRAGYAGSQRYGMMPWSGDVNRSWGGLFSQPEIALQMGMQGLAYMHSDLGGFAGGEKIDDELYVRWLQYGVFQPIFRPHAQEHIPPEPVYQAYRTELFAKDAINLRYQLLPYNYSLAFRNSTQGYPLMTPLFYYETDNPNLLTYDSAYMWGDAFLVSPVKKPGAMYQEIYLPKGNVWIDFLTNQVYKGGNTIKYALSMNNIPVFIKGGSFIPMSLSTQNTASYSLKKFEMHYYSDTLAKTSSYLLYNDDGLLADAYERGEFETIKFNANENNTSDLLITLKKETKKKEFAEENNTIKFCIHNLKENPSLVTVNGQKLSSKELMWNPVNNVLKFEVVCTMKDLNIDIKR